MRADIERACASCCTKFIKVVIQFLFDPLDAVLDQGDEVKVGMEQFGEVLLGVIAIVRDDLRIAYAKYLQLF